MIMLIQAVSRRAIDLRYVEHILITIPTKVPLFYQFIVVVGEDESRLVVYGFFSVIHAYDMMMTTSPTCTSRAAAPLRQIVPVPRSPGMT
jgi:hypothetical protein